MKIFILFLTFSCVFGQFNTPLEYWKSLQHNEKISFINGAFSMASSLKAHHQHQVKEQYTGNKNWIQPYYIDRYYEIIDEHIAIKVDGNIDVIAKAMDAFYTNSDNQLIPVMDALRIVSMVQDGDYKKADLYLMKAQRERK